MNGFSQGVVAIDDSGTPGTQNRSASLPLQRKTWVAVIVHPNTVLGVSHAMSMLLEGIKSDYGAAELHFTDIYSGRGVFKGVEDKKRLELFDLMASMFHDLEIPIVVQTLAPEHLAEIGPKLPASFPGFSWFRLDNHEHVALLFLLCRVRSFVREHGLAAGGPLSAIIDQGQVKAGSHIPVPQWADMFAYGKVLAHESQQVPLLQLADFAAFVTARQQWVAAAGIGKKFDKAFLSIVGNDRLWYPNLASFAFAAGESSTEIYEDLLRVDRLMKGLPEELSSSGRHK
jgi:hypothetical protein